MENLKVITTNKDYLLLDEEAGINGYAVFHLTTLQIGVFLSWGLSTDNFNVKYSDEPHASITRTKNNAKIVAHLPLNNAPVLEGVPLLPPFGFRNKKTGDIARQYENGLYDYPEERIKHKAGLGDLETLLSLNDIYEPVYELPKQEEDWGNAFNVSFPKAENIHPNDRNTLKDGFMEGYKAASQKRWSDEDMKKAMLHYHNQWGTYFRNNIERFRGSEGNYARTCFDAFYIEYLQSLSPVTLPVGFEPAIMDDPNWVKDDSKRLTPPIIFKTIKTDKGEVLQGTYKF